MSFPITIANRFAKITDTLVKTLAYPFHFFTLDINRMSPEEVAENSYAYLKKSIENKGN